MKNKKVLLIYASETGNTADIARRIAAAFGSGTVDLRPVSELTAGEISPYPYLIFGTPTWGSGEFHDDFFVFTKRNARELDLEGKKIALFGLGDQKYYGDTFVNGMRQLYDFLIDKGAEIIGSVSTQGYDFSGSEAVIDGRFVGLPVDEENQSEKSDERIRRWVTELQKHFI